MRPRRLAVVRGMSLLVATTILLAAILVGYKVPWTGFGEYVKPSEKHQPAKTLWDWMQLFLIPAVLVIGAAWFNQRREKLAREIEDRHRDEERAIEGDRRREDRLQNYLDRMTELMLKEGLRTSKPEDEVRGVARARTLTVLRGLDGERKCTLLQFLWESKLIEQQAVIDLNEADLSEADLGVADLRGASLGGADLSEADLGGADLRGADLRGANLRWAGLGVADLRGADLRGADLRGAQLQLADLGGACGLTQEQLESASGDDRTTLPEGLVRPKSWATG